MLRSVVLIAALVLSLVPVVASADVTGSFVARIIDREGNPVEGVTVEVFGGALLTPRVVHSDLAGEIRISLIPVGTYEVRATRVM